MKAIVLAKFVGESSEELSLEAGAVVDVLQQGDDGWWDIQYEDQIGIFPYTYLQLCEQEEEENVNKEANGASELEEAEEEAELEEQQVEECKEEINEVEEVGNDSAEETPLETQNSEENQQELTDDQQEKQVEVEEEPTDNTSTLEQQEETPLETNYEESKEEEELPSESEKTVVRSLPSVPGTSPIRGSPLLPPRGGPIPPRGAPSPRGGTLRPLPPIQNGPPRGGTSPLPVRTLPPQPRGAPQPRGGATPIQPVNRGSLSPSTPPRSLPPITSSANNNNNNIPNNISRSPQPPRMVPGNRLSLNTNSAGIPRALPPTGQPPLTNNVGSGSPPVVARRLAPTSYRASISNFNTESIQAQLAAPIESVNDDEAVQNNNSNNENNDNESQCDDNNNNNNNNNSSDSTPSENVNNEETMTDEERAKLEQHRRNVVDEIITTEKDYIADLEIVVKVFINPLQEKGLISRDDIQTLFSNLSVILSVNKEVARLFETRSDEEKDGPLLVGDIFLKMADFFKMYTTYCANQPKALATLDRLSKVPAFSDFLQECLLNPDTRALTLFSFLIKPIQRICKYPLLLKDLLKHTEKNHPDYENLDNALNKINDVVEYVNERKRLAENLQKILEIQNQIENCSESLVSPSRRFVRELQVNVFEKNRRQQRKMFVFNDLIVLTKEKKGILGSAKDHFTGSFHLNDVKLVEMADSDDIVDACEVRPKDPKEKALILAFLSTNEKRAWLKEVKMLVREFQKKEAQAAKEALLKKAEEGDSTPPPGDFTPSVTDSPKSGRNTLRNTMPNLSPVNPPLKQSGLAKAQPPAGHKAGQRATPIAPPPPPPAKKSSGSSIFGKKTKKDETPKPKKSVSPLVTPSKLNNQFSKELARTLQKKQQQNI